MPMVKRPWGVSAYGAASVEAVPDVVRVRFRVVRLEPTAEAAFAAAGAAVQAVRESLRAHGVPEAGVKGSGLRLSTEWGWSGEQRRFLGYRCEAGYAVESGDLEGAQHLLLDLLTAGANELESVDFDVREAEGLRTEARRRAVAAAREKAELYAGAAGVRLGSVLHVEDADPEDATPLADRAAAAKATAENLAPGHVVVSAAVVLGFAIAP